MRAGIPRRKATPFADRGHPGRGQLRLACLTTILLLARNAEASWAGLFGTFPCIMLAVLVVTDLEAGPGAGVELLRAYPIGKCSTLAFLAAFDLLTPALGPVAGYAVGYLAAGGVLAGMARSARLVTCTEPALTERPCSISGPACSQPRSSSATANEKNCDFLS